MTDKNTEDRLADLEKTAAVKGIEFEMRLQKQDETLQEIKQVLVETREILKGQSEIVVDIVRIQGRISEIEARQELMKQIIEDRRDETNPAIIEGRDFMSKAKMLGAVAAILFGLSQTIISGYVSDNKDQLRAIRQEVTELKSDHSKTQIELATVKSLHDQHHSSETR